MFRVTTVTFTYSLSMGLLVPFGKIKSVASPLLKGFVMIDHLFPTIIIADLLQ